MKQENKYNKCLGLFIAKNNKFHKWKNQPFQLEEMAMATDGINAIKIPIELTENIDSILVEKEELLERIKTVLTSIESKEKEIIKVSDIVCVIGKTPLIDDFEECEYCEGHGKVDWDFEHFTKEDDCPSCHGYGKKKNSNNKVADNDWLIKIKETKLKHRFVLKLVQVCDILEVDKIFIYSQTERSITFKVGECEILMMRNMEENDKFTELIETP